MTTYRIISQCSGGEHLQVEVTDDNGKAQVVPMLLSELQAIKPVDPVEDIRRLVLGKPLADVVAELTAGIDTKVEVKP